MMASNTIRVTNMRYFRRSQLHRQLQQHQHHRLLCTILSRNTHLKQPWVKNGRASILLLVEGNNFPSHVPCYLSTDVSPKDAATGDAKSHRTTTSFSSSSSALTKAYLDLSKAKLSSLVVATTAAGFLAAGTGPLTTMSAACLGTALCSSSAAGWNQILEASRDAKMKRTQQRPLVTGALSPTHAAVAATCWGVTGTGVLAIGTDPYTTALGVGNIILYSGVYTYMKPRNVYNTWVGAIVGAIPPVMGWSAATGGSILDVEALFLGATLYYWQLPHFMALSYMHRVDYARGGFAMLPVTEPSGVETANVMMRNALYLSTIPMLATATNVTSSMFCLEGFVLNGYALYVARQFQLDRTNAKARKVFLTSLWYLPCLLMLFLLHSKTWDEKNTEDNVLRAYISRYLHEIRETGRKLCVHETQMEVIQSTVSWINGAASSEAYCPVILTRKESSRMTKESQEVLKVAQTAANITTQQE